MQCPLRGITSPRDSFGTPSVSSTPPLYPEEPAKEEQTTPEIQISGFIFRYRDHSVRMALNKVKYMYGKPGDVNHKTLEMEYMTCKHVKQTQDKIYIDSTRM